MKNTIKTEASINKNVNLYFYSIAEQLIIAIIENTMGKKRISSLRNFKKQYFYLDTIDVYICSIDITFMNIKKFIFWTLFL